MQTAEIRTLYRELTRDLRSIGGVVIAVIMVFLSGAVLGIVYHGGFPDIARSFGTIVEGLSPHRGLSLIGLIFLRNSTAAAIAIVSGYVIGIFPMLAALVNGVIVGMAFGHLDASQRMPALLLLLPHGLFELPAMFISWGLGVQKGMAVVHSLAGQPPEDRQIRAARIFCFVVIPLLVIAAFVEGTMISIMKGQ